MAVNPYAAFADEVSPANAAAATASNDYSAFADAVDAPVENAAPPALTPDAFNAEVRRRAQAGEDASEIRAWASTVKNPASPALKYTIGPELESVVENIRGGSTRPVSTIDVTKPDALMAGLRGFVDAGSLDNADEIEAAIRSGAISGPEYEAEVARQRALRAIDAETNPAERFLGQGVGTVASAFAPAGRILDTGGILARAAKGAAAGAGANLAATYGASQSGEEFVNRAPSSAAVGAVGGFASPFIGAAAKTGFRELREIFNDEAGAAAALRGADIDMTRVEAAADVIRRTERREPTLLELLTESEAARLTPAIARSRQARERVVDATNTAQREMGEKIRDFVPASSGLDEAALGIPPASAGNRPFDRLAPVDTVIGRAENPQALRNRAAAFADQAFSKFRNDKFELNDESRATLEDVFPKLPGREFNEIKARFVKDELTLGDMDRIRRGLNKKGASGATDAYDLRQQAGDVLAFMSEQKPETAQAVGKMATLMRAADGAEIGLTAAKPGTDLNTFVDNMLRLTERERKGVPAGARQEIVSQTMQDPYKVYTFAKQIELAPEFGKRLGIAIGPTEAQSIADMAVRQKKGIDAMLALARIPTDKVDTALRSAEGMVDIVAATALGGGGAFKAGIVNDLLKRANIGKGAAEKLADKLLDPAQRRAAIAAMGNLPSANGGKLYGRAPEIIRNAFMLTAAQIGKDNARMPEGFVGVGTEPNE